jgi:hypothetical protein
MCRCLVGVGAAIVVWTKVVGKLRYNTAAVGDGGGGEAGCSSGDG